MRQSPQNIVDSVRWFSGGELEVTRSAMYGYLEVGQKLPPHLQIIGQAASLVTMCEAVGLKTHEVLKVIDNMKADLDAPFAHTINAAKAYAQGELF